MPRSAADALLWAVRQHVNPTRDWHGMGLMFVRSAFAAPPLYGSAASAWKACDFPHPLYDGDKAPRGAPYYWTGGRHGYGHVALIVGNGLCWSTDAHARGRVDLVRINDLTEAWGLTPAGWAEDINDTRIWHTPAVTLTNVLSAAEVRRRPGGLTAGVVADVLRVERCLARRGYLAVDYIGGVYGTRTIEAMHRFQQDRGLSGRGLPTRESIEAVLKGWYRLV